MKNLMKYIAVVSLAVVLTSCKDFLDTTPSTALTTSEAIECYDDAVSSLVGVYDAVQGNSDNLGWYGARAVYYGDVRGDLMQSETDGSRTRNLYEMNYDANTNLPEMWSVPYDAIRRASNLIAAIDGGLILDADEYEDELKDIYAQAVVIRALAHFDLCKVYGKLYTDDPTSLGVPIVDFVADPTYKPERNTVAEVYNFVIEQINGVKGNLSKDVTYGFVNYWAAQSLLSRIYLFKGDYSNSLTAAKDVIENGPYQLWSNAEYATAWGDKGGSEFIWEIVSNGSDDWIDREGVPYLLYEGGYSDYIISKKGVEMFASRPNDVRAQVTGAPQRDDKPYKSRYGTDKVYTLKYPGNGSDVRVNNIYAIRLSEIYLNAAEAAFNAKSMDDLMKYYNAIAMRADNTVAAVPASNITLDMILDQRGLELIGEGFRYFDLARNSKQIDRSVRYTHIFPDPQAESYNRSWYKAILAIPLAEMNANKDNMEQNPGY